MTNQEKYIEHKTKYLQLLWGRNYNPDDIQYKNSLYISKIPQSDYYLVAEQLTSENVIHWKNYISQQSDSRVIIIQSSIHKHFSGDGSKHFALVLNDFNQSSTNIVLICYITTHIPAKMDANISRYKLVNKTTGWISNDMEKYAANIIMYVTVTFDPNGVLASHMGVSTSIEALGKHRGLSVHLHSFAAKCVLKINDKVKYQVNAPVNAMLNIFLNALPNYVYVGTKEMLELLDERGNIRGKDYKSEHGPSLVQEFKERIIKNMNALDKNNKYDLDEFNKLKAKLEKLNSEGVDNKDIQKTLDNMLAKYADPYTYVDKNDKKVYSLNVLLQYPPILSIPNRTEILIYEPCKGSDKPRTFGKPIFNISRNDPTYRWLSTTAFYPAGMTNYIAIDYIQLANSKPISSIENKI